MNTERIIFDDWEKVLKEHTPENQYRAYREAIIKFRYWLRETGSPPTVPAFKQHLKWKSSYLPPKELGDRRVKRPLALGNSTADLYDLREGRNRHCADLEFGV